MVRMDSTISNSPVSRSRTRRYLKKTLKILGLLAAALPVIAILAGLFPRNEGAQSTGYGERNVSRYLTMRDGTRIAVETWLPEGLAKGDKTPTLMIMTRYWRSTELGFLNRVMVGLRLQSEFDTIGAGPVGRLNRGGYAVVLVDARGSGASFGSRPVEFAPAEIADYGEVASWIAKQPWSNGRVGALGVSYDGNTAEMIALNRNPAVQALAPLYGDFDPQFQLAQPGGVHQQFMTVWGRIVAAMDKNDVCAVMAARSAEGMPCFLLRLFTPGVKPVDGPDGEKLLREAVAQRRNADVGAAMKKVEFRDDLLGDTQFQMPAISPYGHIAQFDAAQTPMNVWVGWYDSATIAGALQRYVSTSYPQWLVIGPYSHGGRHDTDPFVAPETPVEPGVRNQVSDVMLKHFFDCRLKTPAACAASNDKRVTYFTMGERRWRTTAQWPPAHIARSNLYLGDGQSLVSTPPQKPGSWPYAVDFSHSTGASSRWATSVGGPDVIYRGLDQTVRKGLSFLGNPLPHDLEITGAPVATISLSSSAPDTAVFAYLLAELPGGRYVYLTEGVLRASHRKLATMPAAVTEAIGPQPTHLRADVLPLAPGATERLTISLYPVSIVVPKQSRLLLVFAGADTLQFVRLPASGPVRWQLGTTPDAQSMLSLPMAWRDGSIRLSPGSGTLEQAINNRKNEQ
jgi:uncharacterized protein